MPRRKIVEQPTIVLPTADELKSSIEAVIEVLSRGQFFFARSPNRPSIEFPEISDLRRVYLTIEAVGSRRYSRDGESQRIVNAVRRMNHKTFASLLSLRLMAKELRRLINEVQAEPFEATDIILEMLISLQLELNSEAED